MLWLVFGAKGWIGKQIVSLLEMYGEQVIKSTDHFLNFHEVKALIDQKAPDRIVCAVGRTYGPGFTTIDYLEQKGKLIENLDSNLLLPVWIAQSTTSPVLYFGTGCIYEYDTLHTEQNRRPFNETDEPNFTGSSYSTVKRATDKIMEGFPHVLNARIRMPITLESNSRDFITKIMGYSKITSIRNSMTVLEDILPRLLALTYEGTAMGTYNAVNPLAMTHAEILALFERDHETFTLEPVEEQNKRLLSRRSNNILDSTKLELACKNLQSATKEKFSISEKLPTLFDSLRKIHHFRKGDSNRILVTGGFGFIASNFINKWMKKNPYDFIVNVDRLDTCSNRNNVINKYPLQYTETIVDIQNVFIMKTILDKYNINYIFHFAAETHVDNSFGNSLSFTKSNVLGTHCLLEVARLHKPLERFYHMSTDEVYGEIKEGAFNEESLLYPTNPYAATKAAAEHIVHSYGCSFKVPYIILRANNIYGIQQYPEKVIPAFITRLLDNQKLKIQGDGSAKRMFLHVNDLIEAIQVIHEMGKNGEIYNIGTNEEYTVKEIAELLHFKIKGRPLDDSSIEYVPDRLFNDCRYSIDTSKVESLGWKKKRTLPDSLDELISWYSTHQTYWRKSEE